MRAISLQDEGDMRARCRGDVCERCEGDVQGWRVCKMSVMCVMCAR